MYGYLRRFASSFNDFKTVEGQKSDNFGEEDVTDGLRTYIEGRLDLAY
jgi:hypothetical protein